MSCTTCNHIHRAQGRCGYPVLSAQKALLTCTCDGEETKRAVAGQSWVRLEGERADDR